MRTIYLIFALALLPCALPSSAAEGQSAATPSGAAPDIRRADAEALFNLTNQARSAAGGTQLQWDEALYQAALQHCQRMAVEAQIGHRYDGEADLAARAAQAGAHSSTIEENVATGPNVETIQASWTQSAPHRANMLNSEVDHAGIAVVANHGQLYAVAVYSRAFKDESPAEVEAQIAELLRTKGLDVQNDPTDARAYCALEHDAQLSSVPGFKMLWQSQDLAQLPQPLLDRIASGRYQRATVGSCPPPSNQGLSSCYRVAVLLYGSAASSPKPMNSKSSK
jgi:uncharacterized protein YkwD